MATWKYACKTLQGMNLDLKILGREGESLTLTGAWSGSGYVNPTKLMTLIDIDQRVQKLNLLDAVEFLDENTVRIPIILKNTDVVERYGMHQIGIYAEDPDIGEILYIVLQSDSEEEIPSNKEMKDFTLEWYLNVSIGNTQNVEVIIDKTCDLTVEQADARYVRKEKISDSEVTFEEAEKRENIGAGEKLSTIFGKIKKWFADLNPVAFSGSYKDLEDKPTAKDIGLGDVGNYKAVSTVASQGLSDVEKANARANIGAGTSNFSGDYNNLANKPELYKFSLGTIPLFSNIHFAGGPPTYHHISEADYLANPLMFFTVLNKTGNIVGTYIVDSRNARLNGMNYNVYDPYNGNVGMVSFPKAPSASQDMVFYGNSDYSVNIYGLRLNKENY